MPELVQGRVVKCLKEADLESALKLITWPKIGSAIALQE